MLAYMIYERDEGEKNRGFIEMFQKEGVRYGISFLFIAKEEYREKKLPDLVLNRTRDQEVSIWYEKRDVPVLHGSKLVEIGNDKWKTISYLKKIFEKEEHFSSDAVKMYGEKKVLPDTLYFPKFEEEEFERRVLEKGWHRGENLVLKTVDGHGGDEVFLISSDIWGENEHLEKKASGGCFKSFLKCGDGFENILGRRCILQEQIKSKAMDVRVYIVGNEIYHGVLRKGTHDFRSNFSLGGSVREYIFTEKEKELVRKVLKAFSRFTLGLAGLDFLVTEEGNLVFNELEEMAGCRMLYACTERDIVKDYVRWIADLYRDKCHCQKK